MGNLLPAEWHRQSAVWLAWPLNKQLWADSRGRISSRFAALAAKLSQTIAVNLICRKACQGDVLQKIFQHGALLGNIHLLIVLNC